MGRKWANIVAKKTAKDGANSKVYAKFGVEIYVAAKKGDPDPESNTALKFVIDRAKQAQVNVYVISGCKGRIFVLQRNVIHVTEMFHSSLLGNYRRYIAL